MTPKRKHHDLDHDDFDSTTRATDGNLTSVRADHLPDAESPRAKVAKRLQDLEISHGRFSAQTSSLAARRDVSPSSDAVRRKRISREEGAGTGVREEKREGDGDLQDDEAHHGDYARPEAGLGLHYSTPLRPWSGVRVRDPNDGPEREIAETPGAYGQLRPLRNRMSSPGREGSVGFGCSASDMDVSHSGRDSGLSFAPRMSSTSPTLSVPTGSATKTPQSNSSRPDTAARALKQDSLPSSSPTPTTLTYINAATDERGTNNSIDNAGPNDDDIYPTPDQSHLTWQDSEITGHEIDTTTPDDDGEGINGLGFKPTAAMARARSLKRRQQVSAWRTREAREARDARVRRLGRRRGLGESEGEAEGGREMFAAFGAADWSANGATSAAPAAKVRRVVRFA